MLPIAELNRIVARYEELVASLGDANVATDPIQLKEIGQEQASCPRWSRRIGSTAG